MRRKIPIYSYIVRNHLINIRSNTIYASHASLQSTILIIDGNISFNVVLHIVISFGMYHHISSQSWFVYME